MVATARRRRTKQAMLATNRMATPIGMKIKGKVWSVPEPPPPLSPAASSKMGGALIMYPGPTHVIFYARMTIEREREKKKSSSIVCASIKVLGLT